MISSRSLGLAIVMSAIAAMSLPVVGTAAAPQSSEGGAELIDGGTFIAGPPEHIDPALNSTLDAYQVINAMYDGLTDIDVSDPENTGSFRCSPSPSSPTRTPRCGRSRSARV